MDNLQVLDFKGWCERGESNPYGCPLDPKYEKPIFRLTT
jgi:hypothetical protein